MFREHVSCHSELMGTYFARDGVRVRAGVGLAVMDTAAVRFRVGPGLQLGLGLGLG